MVTLKIDSTKYTVEDQILYLNDVIRLLAEGARIGEDWDLEGEEKGKPVELEEEITEDEIYE